MWRCPEDADAKSVPAPLQPESEADLAHVLTGDHPGLGFGPLHVDGNPANDEVDSAPLLRFKLRTQNDLDPGADVGLFGLLQRINGESSRSWPVDDFIERLLHDAFEHRPRSLAAVGTDALEGWYNLLGFGVQQVTRGLRGCCGRMDGG